MEISLTNIQHFIQSYAFAISTVLNADVTVVDEKLVRIAGTNLYSNQIGQTISHAELYRKVLISGQPNVMIKKAKYTSCCQCILFEECRELADIAYPIFHSNQVIGVIGIIAFTKESQNNLVHNNKNYLNFLKHMSLLLESKLVTSTQNIILNHQEQVTDLLPQKNTIAQYITEDNNIQKILDTISQMANSDTTILITGESGTGKEVLSQFIHQSSNRSNKKMISLNCGAIPENLIESELFGYEKGAFTGANKDGQPGKFELANGSTLLLDEIGEMPLPAQTRLLRVLQDKIVQRIGSKEDIKVDVKIICSTNQNLMQLVSEKKFRADLYYRINVIPFHLSPLRDRRGDIKLLVKVFLDYFNRKLSKQIEIDDKIINFLNNYHWPGNIRELKNVIEYIVNTKMSGIVQYDDLPSYITGSVDSPSESLGTLKEMVKIREGQLLQDMFINIQSTKEKKQLANKLGISISSLYRKVAQYKLTQQEKNN